MSIIFEERLSDSPFIETITRGHTAVLSTYRSHSIRIADTGTMRESVCPSIANLHGHLEVADLRPDLKSAPTFPTIFISWQPMATWTEELTDGAERGEEALSMTRRIEATHHALPLARWLVRVF